MKIKLTHHAIVRFKERITSDVDRDFIFKFVTHELSIAKCFRSFNGVYHYHSSGITFVVSNRKLITLYLEER